MSNVIRKTLSTSLLMLGLFFTASDALSMEQQRGGVGEAAEALYSQRCANCHDNPSNNTPPRAALAYRNSTSIVRVLRDGSMRNMAAGLSDEQVRSLAVLLTGNEPGPAVDVMSNACSSSGGPVTLGGKDWPSLGGDFENSRHRGPAGIRAADILRLKPKWIFGIPGGAPGTVALAGGRLYLATGTGHVISLDATSGCVHWAYDTVGSLVRRVSVAAIGGEGSRAAVFFGDAKGNVTALDAATGGLLWNTQVERHALARVTAAPSVYNGRVYVPMSSIEDPLTHDESHACCTFRGSVAALDASTGRLLWKRYTIPEQSRQLAAATNAEPAKFGPAGAAVYLPLAIDVKRNLVYASTAESYTYDNPVGPYSVIAYELETGAVRWQRQFLPEAKERKMRCERVGDTDCRNLFSMGTAVTIHQQSDGTQILLVAQKSGDVYALDPDDDGRVIWQRNVAIGGDLGGIMYGMSAIGEVVYVPISDAYSRPPHQPGGLAAIDTRNGKIRWQVPAPKASCNWGGGDCNAAVVAAATTLPGVILLGHNDGHLRAYSTTDGKLIWDVDTAANYETVNGVSARGGQVNGYPVVIGDRAIYVVSGAASQARPGNALLMYTVDGK